MMKRLAPISLMRASPISSDPAQSAVLAAPAGAGRRLGFARGKTGAHPQLKGCRGVDERFDP